LLTVINRTNAADYITFNKKYIKFIFFIDHLAHPTRGANNDIKRENVIKELCSDCVFIRYDPYSREFDIFKTINCIYNTIKSRNVS